MALLDCSFETSRLLVKEWHSLSPNDWREQSLATLVAMMLTPAVTRHLHEQWRGAYSEERAVNWVAQRDAEGVALLVIERTSGDPVGLVIVGSDDAEERLLRLGYLLSEKRWGEGFATELVSGFAEWCRTHNVASIAGGVEAGNEASIRVLEKCGFERETGGAAARDEHLYRLTFRSYQPDQGSGATATA